MQGWQSSNISRQTGIDMEVLEQGPSGKAKQPGLSRETFIKISQIMPQFNIGWKGIVKVNLKSWDWKVSS